jgi:serine/threonine protein kinase
VPVVGELIAGRYELEELIGTGGMSTVFRARDTQLDRLVALKILHEQYSRDDEYVERFRREARSAAQLSHPNVVRVIDRGGADGREFIVLEYVEGENLKQLVTRTGPLPVRRALELAIQTGRALAFAHEQGLVHRDVKPQNVLLGNGEAKVTDFGIARAVAVNGLTQTGTVLGTSEYIAPEQARGLGGSERGDVYGLGIVLFELLTGRVPFSGDNFVHVAMRHVNEPAPSVLDRRPDAPLRVASAVARALEKDPDDRFPSMRDFVAELQACLAGLGEPDQDATLVIRETPTQLRPRPRRRRRRPSVPALLLLLGALAAAGAIGGYLATRGGSSASGGSGSGDTSSTQLRAVAAYDPPPGDGSEHDERLGLATDGNPDTYWETEHYASQAFGGLKDGVGLLLNVGKPLTLTGLTIRTDTPGFTAEIKAGSSRTGPFDSVSSSQTVEGTTSFTLHVDQAREFYLVWITSLSPQGDRFQTHVNEVTTGSGSASAAARPPASPVSAASGPRVPASHGRGKGHGKAKGRKDD